MVVFELTHRFYFFDGEPVCSPKCLGYFSDEAAIDAAIADYTTQPGFRENPDGFVVRQREVADGAPDAEFFEAMVYTHTEDFDYEHNVELGLFREESAAREAIQVFHKSNPRYLALPWLVCEEIVNRCTLNRRNWTEGFTVEAYLPGSKDT